MTNKFEIGQCDPIILRPKQIATLIIPKPGKYDLQIFEVSCKTEAKVRIGSPSTYPVSIAAGSVLEDSLTFDSEHKLELEVQLLTSENTLLVMKESSPGDVQNTEPEERDSQTMLMMAAGAVALGMVVSHVAHLMWMSC